MLTCISDLELKKKIQSGWKFKLAQMNILILLVCDAKAQTGSRIAYCEFVMHKESWPQGQK